MKTIKSRTEFEKVFMSGRRLSGRIVRARVLLTGEGDLGKVAFVAPKRLGNAVYRNRCKRVLREAARMAGLPMEGVNVILLATQDTHGATPNDLAACIKSLLAKAGLR